MNHCVFAILSLSLILALESQGAAALNNSIVIRTVMVIDGTGAEPYGPTDVEILGNRISRIGVRLKSNASTEINGVGKTLIPGLIDCHTHIRTVPGSIFRNESPDAIRAQQKKQLQAYIAVGVTTVLDAATPTALFGEVAQIAQENVVPRFLGLSPFLTPKSGYFADDNSRRSFYDDLAKPIENLSDIRDRIAESVTFHPVGVKVTMEFGFSPVTAFPVFNEEFRAKIREEAQKANLPIFVHAETEKAFELALDLKPYAFMHGGFFDKSASPEIIFKIKQSGAYVVTTLAIYQLMLLMWDQKSFEDPWFRMLVPEKQLESAKETTEAVVKLLAVQNKPWFVPTFLAEWLGDFFLNRKSIQKNYLNSRNSITSMYRAGVPLVMGSDSGNYPLFSTFFHGVGSILEIESLIDAGLPVTEAVRASTSRAATMLKIDQEVGTVSVGKIADLILLNQNPLTVPKAFRDVNYVFKDGQAKHPEDWMRN